MHYTTVIVNTLKLCWQTVQLHTFIIIIIVCRMENVKNIYVLNFYDGKGVNLDSIYNMLLIQCIMYQLGFNYPNFLINSYVFMFKRDRICTLFKINNTRKIIVALLKIEILY